MAITRQETQVQWAGPADSDSIAAGGNETSLEINLDATCVAAQLHLKADNSTTPAADDQINFWLLQTGGDPDGAGSDEFDTTGHALHLGIIDTFLEDPGLLTVRLPIPQKGAKIYAEGVTAGTTNAITVSATMELLQSSQPTTKRPWRT